MTNLTEISQWTPAVYLLDANTPVIGGQPEFNTGGEPTAGWANVQAKQLADRTQYLKDTLDANDVPVLSAQVTQLGAALDNHIGVGGAIPHPTATTLTSGFMSAPDKAKLDNVQENAQVNAVSSVVELTGAITTAQINSAIRRRTQARILSFL